MADRRSGALSALAMVVAGGCASRTPPVTAAAAALATPAEKPRPPQRLRRAAWKATFAPDGKRLAYAREPTGIAIFDPATGAERSLSPEGKDPAWSPDGRSIAYAVSKGAAEEIWLAAADGRAPPRRLAEGSFPSWTRDGQAVLVHAGGAVTAVPVAGGGAPSVYYDKSPPPYPTVSPDGARIAGGIDAALVIQDRGSGATVARWPTPGARGLLASYSPDGKRLAVGGFNGDPLGLWVVDVERARAVQVAPGYFTMPAWSADGARLAFDQRLPGGNDLWWVDRRFVEDCLTRAAVPATEIGRGGGACAPPAKGAAETSEERVIRDPRDVTVLLDVSRAPDLNDWGTRAQRLCEIWYAVIADMLPSDRPTYPDRISLVLVPEQRAPASANRNQITVSAAWVRSQLEKGNDDLGMVIHELTHLVQRYNRGVGWLTEGIADYIRYNRFEPTLPRKKLDLDKARHTDGYWTTAAFLLYLEQTHDRAIVPKLHRAIASGTYRDDLFKDLTGKPVDALWQDFVAKEKATREAPRPSS